MSQPVQSVLVTAKLNIVGEDHSESDARRAAEKQFVLAMINSSDYWTENSFPDLQQAVGIRRARGGQQQAQSQGNGGADLMEFRAVHGAAMLISRSKDVCQKATRIAALPIGPVNPTKLAAVVNAFDDKINAFRNVRNRLANSWRPTQTGAVNAAVQAVFTNAENAYQMYFNAPRQTLPEVIGAAGVLANGLTALDGLLPALQSAVGLTKGGGADALAQKMRTDRSAFMGLAAGLARRSGVWKVGDLHIADLKSGAAKVDMSRMNVVTRDEFNRDFDAWQARQVSPQGTPQNA